MKDLRFCLEVHGLAVDEDGQPAPAGLNLVVGQCEDERHNELYTKMVKNADIPAILKLAMLDRNVRAEDCRIISPEEYDEKYGDKSPEAPEGQA